MRRGVLHHLIIRVSDAERSARFYVPILRFLGYECAGSSPRHQDWRLIIEGAPHEISFVSVAPALQGIQHVRDAAGQQDHFAWTATSRQEVDLFYTSVLVPLAAAGDCVVLDPPVRCPEYSPEYYAVYFEDRDGLKFEFVFNPPIPLQTEQNKTVVRAFVEAINQKDWQRFDELVAPDFSRHSSTSGQAKIRSRDQFRDFLAGEASTFPDAHETIHFLVAEGDKVAVHSGFRGTQCGSMGPYPALNRTLSADFITIYRVADGRIAEAWVEWDCLSGLIQLGHFVLPSTG